MRRRLVLLLAVASAGAALLRPRRMTVEGASMTPALSPGDRVLVVRTALGLPALRPGAVVAVRDPRDERRTLIKRLVAKPGTWWPAAQVNAGGAVPSLEEASRGSGLVVFGDAPDASTDSRTFGPVPRRLLQGRAIYRYHPSDKVGLL